MNATMTKDTTYNGWKNRQTWNVALWIGNDEPLYRAAVYYAKGAKRPTYDGFLAFADLTVRRTPDGVAWGDKQLDRKALNKMMAEFAND